jgi:histidyl-tRNA synthetase
VVFEAFDAGRELRAICGGGRYDRLLENLGGPSMPAVGFGFGDVVIVELLAQLGLLPELRRDLDAVVLPLSEAERPHAVRLAAELRSEGLKVELVLSDKKLQKALAAADRSGARRAYLVGADEVARGEALVRDMETGQETPRKLPR